MDFFAYRHKPLSAYKRGDVAMLILSLCAGIILVGGVAVAAPTIAALVKILGAKNNRERLKVKRSVTSLAKAGYVKKGRSGRLIITRNGLVKSEYEALRINPSKWDRKWRLVMFDIPEKKRKSRVALSHKILDMGMRHVQDSVFISPYPCEKEIALAARYLRVDGYVQIAEANCITEQKKFIKEFSLK